MLAYQSIYYSLFAGLFTTGFPKSPEEPKSSEA